MTASDPKRIDPADPPLEHLAIDPELGPPPEGYGGRTHRREPEDFDAADSTRTTGAVPEVEEGAEGAPDA